MSSPKRKSKRPATPAQIQLTPDRKTINADGEDVSVFTVSAAGRARPRGAGGAEQNQFRHRRRGQNSRRRQRRSELPRAGHVHSAICRCAPSPVNDWRWKLARRSEPTRALLPEYAPDFDDSSWNTIKPKTDGDTGDTGHQSRKHDGHLPRARQVDGRRLEQSGRANPFRRLRRSTAGIS